MARYFKTDCSHCGGHLEFPAELFGTETDCPHCHAQTLLSATEEVPSEASAGPLPPPPAPPPTPAPAPVQHTPTCPICGSTNLERRRPISTVGVILVIIGVPLVTVGVLLMFYGLSAELDPRGSDMYAFIIGLVMLIIGLVPLIIGLRCKETVFLCLSCGKRS